MSITFTTPNGFHDLNVCNSNARIILQAAGINPEAMWELESIPIERIEVAIDVLSEGVSLVRQPTRTQGPGCVTYEFGCSVDQMRRYSEALHRIVAEARANGHTAVSIS